MIAGNGDAVAVGVNGKIAANRDLAVSQRDGLAEKIAGKADQLRGVGDRRAQGTSPAVIQIGHQSKLGFDRADVHARAVAAGVAALIGCQRIGD